MKLNRTLVLCLSIVLAASMALGGTLAFLTDTETEVNEFTVGNVDIELREDFDEENAELMPGVVINKDVKIANVGNNNAWVWYTYAVPAELDGMLIIDNINGNENEPWMVNAGVWDTEEGYQTVMIENREYHLYACLYKDILEKGAETAQCMDSVTLDPRTDFDPLTGNFYLVEGGNIVASASEGAMHNAKIIVTAYAMQADGLEDIEVTDAFNMFSEQWGGYENAINNTIVTEVDTEEELLNALHRGGVIKATNDIVLTKKLVIEDYMNVTLDMNGHNLTTYAVDGNYDVVIKGNLTITRANNVNVSGDYGFGTSTGGGWLTVNGGNWYHEGVYMFGCFGGEIVLNNGNFNGNYCIGNAFDGYNGWIIVNGAACELTNTENDETSAEFLGPNIQDNRI